MVTTTLVTRGRPETNSHTNRRKARQYRVRIERLLPWTQQSPSLPYSLANLGIQSRRWRVALLSVTGTNVVLRRHEMFSHDQTPAEIGPLTGVEQKVDIRLRRAQPTGTGKPQEGLVWLLNFDEQWCELLIGSRRPVRDTEMKPLLEAEVSGKGPKSDHETWPPPPEGGGDEEEEGQEGNEEDQDGSDDGE